MSLIITHLVAAAATLGFGVYCEFAPERAHVAIIIVRDLSFIVAGANITMALLSTSDRRLWDTCVAARNHYLGKVTEYELATNNLIHAQQEMEKARAGFLEAQQETPLSPDHPSIH